MPRTKRPVNKKEKPTEVQEEVKKLDAIVAEHKNIIDTMTQMMCREVGLGFKLMRESLGPNILKKTIFQMRSDVHTVPESARKAQHFSRPASQDDGYLTENSSQGSGERGKRQMAPPSSGRTTRRSHSADASARKLKAPRTTTQRRRSKSVYRTPAYNRNAANIYPPITPKVAPHTPLAVLRQPRQGEMVLSMSGSPVYVANVNNMQPDEKANCNIMLRDGTMLSVQPKQLRASQAFVPLSLMDTAVLQQLKTLKDNLDMVVKMGERGRVD